MTRPLRLTAAALIVAGLSCARSTTSNPATGPAPTGTGAATAPAAQQPPTAPQRGGEPGGRGLPPGGFQGRGGRVPLTPEQRAARRDSISAERAKIVATELAKIKGREDSSSQDIYQNLELLQDTTAGNLLKLMDEYGRDLSVGCEFCHVPNKWEDDSKEHKQTTRIMIKITNAINDEQLTMLPKDRRGNTPKITCMTCHRGANEPNRAIMP
jgi:hypothetical protein